MIGTPGKPSKPGQPGKGPKPGQPGHPGTFFQKKTENTPEKIWIFMEWFQKITD